MAPLPKTGRGDLAANVWRMVLIWGPGILLITLTGPLGGWGRTLGWTTGLLWLSAMCFWNYARCRRVHCVFTGPFFLAMAGATLLAGFGVWSLGSQTWSVLGDAIALGGVLLCCGPELIWGRYWTTTR